MPGVHSLPEKVLNDQQMNIPHFKFFNSSARFSISTGGGCAIAEETVSASSSANHVVLFSCA